MDFFSNTSDIVTIQMLDEAGLEVLLVNPRFFKSVPGRKTDVQDCRWIQQLHSYGLLRGDKATLFL
ncbi:hypothetical protein NEPTK9_000885 [Candidatus Neptunochlamydia vexilliferae]|uniref:Transposase IS111A/IS1328/IS1533 N-terminal domain-containing protein n=1 Tax=Candidatus Neptunichlamydia vexilliferae TaxID=1651774 RepID=A0ABS0AZ17_9BACT|nr:hypothetical protein [Candidatus Neptunochlamydia vexilliferae]